MSLNRRQQSQHTELCPHDPIEKLKFSSEQIEHSRVGFPEVICSILSEKDSGLSAAQLVS
jgi:hypothetical protein